VQSTPGGNQARRILIAAQWPLHGSQKPQGVNVQSVWRFVCTSYRYRLRQLAQRADPLAIYQSTFKSPEESDSEGAKGKS
jgi:hypothetical protein